MNQIIKRKALAKVDYRKKFEHLSRQVTDLKKKIPTHDKSGKLLKPNEQIKVMKKIIINQRRMKRQKINKNLKSL